MLNRDNIIQTLAANRHIYQLHRQPVVIHSYHKRIRTGHFSGQRGQFAPQPLDVDMTIGNIIQIYEQQSLSGLFHRITQDTVDIIGRPSVLLGLRHA